jgi:hypothetical protein
MNSARSRLSQGATREFSKSLLEVPDVFLADTPGYRDMDRIGHDRRQD